MKTLLRKALKASTVLALAVGALTAGTAAPAMADDASTASCTQYFGWSGTQVQIDQCPGNGARTWTWIWTDSSNTAAVLYLKINGQETSIGTNSNLSASASWGVRVDEIKVCNYFTVGSFPPMPGYSCTAWKDV
ncbi:hypothetical protein ACGFZQ_37040 [Streptomyces sp. NPDC048254]|uniref:hypothetical protein n=1 Tax=Streptomyces sp. NPDC048254 TaxID=3365525 RepID=UPI00371E905A